MGTSLRIRYILCDLPMRYSDSRQYMPTRSFAAVYQRDQAQESLQPGTLGHMQYMNNRNSLIEAPIPGSKIPPDQALPSLAVILQLGRHAGIPHSEHTSPAGYSLDHRGVVC